MEKEEYLLDCALGGDINGVISWIETNEEKLNDYTLYSTFSFTSRRYILTSVRSDDYWNILKLLYNLRVFNERKLNSYIKINAGSVMIEHIKDIISQIKYEKREEILNKI